MKKSKADAWNADKVKMENELRQTMKRVDRCRVPDLSASGDNFDLVDVDPHDPTTTSKPKRQCNR